MAEQDSQQAELQRLEAEDKCMVAEQEAAAATHRLQSEKEEIERKLGEKLEAALLKRQYEENTARRKSVENLKRELARLEELKRLNAAKAKLEVYDEN